jgi:acyl-[acyl-carrier-protein]-phospholipid O-acyltransferase/long-chain-fatty-acid--[acyl-carrier-protein] ligase
MAGYLRHDQPGILQPPVSEAGAGWYETGDIVELDEDGFIRIVGRVKRFAKVAGEMVSLETVEALAAAASPDRAHAASSQPDALKGEALVLFSTDPALVVGTLQLKARELGYPELAIPRKIVRLEALPLLGTGKIDYVSLRHMAESA